MKKSINKLPENIRQSLIATLPFVVTLFLFILVGKFGISKVVSIRTESAKAEKIQTVLTQKLTLLQTLSPTIGQQANITTQALPSENPALAAVLQLKLLASTNSVVISSIKSGAGSLASSGFHEVSINFVIDGNRDQVFNFLRGIAGVSPIMTVGKIRISESLGASRAEVGVTTYWVDLPKTLPSVTSPVSDFTAGEKGILTKIAGLTQPTYQQLVPSQGDINPEPFGEQTP